MRHFECYYSSKAISECVRNKAFVGVYTGVFRAFFREVHCVT